MAKASDAPTTDHKGEDPLAHRLLFVLAPEVLAARLDTVPPPIRIQADTDGRLAVPRMGLRCTHVSATGWWQLSFSGNDLVVSDGTTSIIMDAQSDHVVPLQRIPDGPFVIPRASAWLDAFGADSAALTPASEIEVGDFVDYFTEGAELLASHWPAAWAETAAVIEQLVPVRSQGLTPYNFSVHAFRGLIASTPRPALEGFRVVFSMRWLFTLEIKSVVHVLLAVGPWFVLLPLVATNRLGGLQSYGLVLSAFALGGLAGAALAGSVGRRTRIPGVWGLIGLSLFGVACLSLALPIPLTGILALAALGGAGTQFFDVLKTTAMQKEIPKGFLGRVFAVDFFASFVMMPAGQMLAGLLITSPERANTAAILAAVVIFSTTLLPLFARSVRHLSNQPADDDRVSAAESPE